MRFVGRYIFIMFFVLGASTASLGVCKNDPTAIYRTMMIFLSSLHNMFPLKLGGITLIPGSSPYSYGSPPDISKSPICICMDPFPRIGLTLNFWEVIAVIDTVKDPYCFVAYGLYLPVGINDKQKGGILRDSVKAGEGNILKFMHTHSFSFYPFKILNLMVDSICFQESDLVSYISEVDPVCGDDDEWCTLLGNPEALLLSNAVAQVACNIYDSVRSTVGYPADECFWTAGAHSMYPTTGNSKSQTYVAVGALDFEKTVYKMHRTGMLLGRIGNQGMCSGVYLPIWRKSVYNKQIILPVAFPHRVPVGFPAVLYESGLNPPVPGKNDNLSWFLYRYRSCCAF